MKKPEEIKKGLECCAEDGCKGCPYEDDCRMADGFSEVANDALAYIQQLEAKVPKWISVEERLPELYTSVLVYQTSPNKVINFISIGHLEEDSDGNFAWDTFGSPKNIITHWMSLPEVPEV